MNLLTELREGLAISWRAIRANKLRSVLTTLGIVIGIVTVTLMGTAIEGMNRAFVKNVSGFGADVPTFQCFPIENRHEAGFASGLTPGAICSCESEQDDEQTGD